MDASTRIDDPSLKLPRPFVRALLDHGIQTLGEAWATSRDIPFENVPEWASLPRIRRQLLGDKTVDPFYWASGELPLDPRSTGLQEAA